MDAIKQSPLFVPVRLMIDVAENIIYENFIFNVNDKHTTPLMIAEQICLDNFLPSNFAEVIAGGIIHILNHYCHLNLMAFQNRKNKDNGLMKKLELSIPLGAFLYEDCVLWNIFSHPCSQPEEYSISRCQQSCLCGDSVVVMTQCILDLVLMHKMGFFDVPEKNEDETLEKCNDSVIVTPKVSKIDEEVLKTNNNFVTNEVKKLRRLYKKPDRQSFEHPYCLGCFAYFYSPYKPHSTRTRHSDKKNTNVSSSYSSPLEQVHHTLYVDSNIIHPLAFLGYIPSCFSIHTFKLV